MLQHVIAAGAALMISCGLVSAQPCDGGWARTHQPGFDGPAYASVVWDPDGAGPMPELLIEGGSFTRAGESSAANIAAWDGEVWRSLGTGINGEVRALTVFNGELIAGGSFSDAGGEPANGVARWNGHGWAVLGAGTDGRVLALTVHDGELIAGGEFTAAGGVEADHLAAWDGSAWRSVGAGVNDAVQALLAHDGELIVGGRFTTAGVEPISHIAAWDGSAWRALGAGLDGPVRALIVHGGELFAGGGFTFSGSDWIRAVAVWDGSAWRLTSADGLELESFYAYAFGEYRGELFVGGSNGATIGDFLRWDGTSWVGNLGITSLSSGMGTGGVHAIRAYRDDLYVGGTFNRVWSTPAGYIARWELCMGDMNCDGVVDFADYLEFLNLFDGQDPRADLNGDGVVDFADYLEFLNLFEAGC